MIVYRVVFNPLLFFRPSSESNHNATHHKSFLALDRDESSKRAKNDDESDDGLAAIEALEESAERARKTLASRPFLIAPWVKLREYQQTGLNWLVSLQTRRLNGILADGKLEWIFAIWSTHGFISKPFKLKDIENSFLNIYDLIEAEKATPSCGSLGSFLQGNVPQGRAITF